MESQLQHQSFQRTPRTDLLSDGLVESSCSPRDSQAPSPAPQFKASILQHSAFFMVQLSHPYLTTEKTIVLTKRTFVDKVMSLLFNMLSSFHALEKEMATHSSVLAWRIPGTGEPWWAPVYGVAQSQT